MFKQLLEFWASTSGTGPPTSVALVRMPISLASTAASPLMPHEFPGFVRGL